MEHIRPKKQQRLMQNCDLPTPTKLCFDFETQYTLDEDDTTLAKALHRSQKRAREAEKKMEEALKERDYAINALLTESMRVMSYRRSVMMLEFQIDQMKLKTEEEADAVAKRSRCNRDESEEICGMGKWRAGLLFCLGLAGLGFALTFTFL